MKHYLTIALIVIVAIIIDSLFAYAGLPVATMDLILTPLGLAIIIGVCTPKYLGGYYLQERPAQGHNLKTKLLLLLAVPAILLLGVWSVYAGVTEPFTFYSGVKGNAHGYSLLVMGLAIIACIVATAYASMASAKHPRKRK